MLFMRAILRTVLIGELLSSYPEEMAAIYSGLPKLPHTFVSQPDRADVNAAGMSSSNDRTIISSSSSSEQEKHCLIASFRTKLCLLILHSERPDKSQVIAYLVS